MDNLGQRRKRLAHEITPADILFTERGVAPPEFGVGQSPQTDVPADPATLQDFPRRQMKF
jgi:hypothetical protein